MKRSILPALLLIAPTAAAQDVGVCVDLVMSDVESFDPAIFGPGPRGDVYHVRLTNKGSIDVTSLELSLNGPFVNFASGNPLFRSDSDLPMLGPNTVLDTFFVAENPLFVDAIDEGGVLQASFTQAGGSPLVPAGGDAVVAVLSMPVGATLDFGTWTGRAAIGGQFEEFFFLDGPHECVPEPSAACLLFASLAGAATRRRAVR